MSFLQSLFCVIGSHSSDISDRAAEDVENPLPPCPSSPNCIRVTKKIDAPAEAVFLASEKVLKSMQPERIKLEQDNHKIDTVFKVFVFRDDMSVQLSEGDSATTYVHVRSASREGFADLGVNSRRVKKFLKQLRNQL